MSPNTGIIVAVSVVIYGLLTAAIITVIAFIVVAAHRLKRQKRLAIQTSEPVYEDPDTWHSSVPEASNQTASTRIPLQTLPQTKENVAYGTLPTHTIVAPQFQVEENVAYGIHTNQQQENAAHPIQQQSMANEEYENVKVQHPQPQQQQ